MERQEIYLVTYKTQMETPPGSDLSRYIEVRLFGERPHLRGRRIPVATVAYNARDNHWTVPELAKNFGLSEPEVLAALLYYVENRSVIDTQEEAYQKELDDAYRLHHTE
jgi:uncharacterized protein (DUF433 family)